MSRFQSIDFTIPGVASARLSVVIVDDEPLARSRIHKLLAADPDIRTIDECASVAEFTRLDKEIAPDLVFLDVQMPERSGFALLEELATRKVSPFVIFVTAYSEHAVRAYDTGAIDYLLKPFDDRRFAKAMTRAKAAMTAGQVAVTGDSPKPADITLEPHAFVDRLVINEDNRQYVIPMRSIELVQAAGKHVKIFVSDHCYLSRQSLRNIEARLNGTLFVRVHRSTIVNLDQILELHPLSHGDSELVLKRGTRVLLSRRFRSRLHAYLERT
jgi:two-component system LytT family response regulator